MAQNIIGVLFGVKGGGSLSGESGKLIVSDLTKIINQINNNNKLLPKVKINFDIEGSAKAIHDLKKQLSSLYDMTKNAPPMPSPPSNNNNNNGNGNNGKPTKQQSDEYKNAKKDLAEYIRLSKELERIKSRSDTIEGDWESGFISKGATAEVKELIKAHEELRKRKEGIQGTSDTDNQNKFGSENWSDLSERYKTTMRDMALSSAKMEASAQSSWDNLRAKAMQYVRDVEFAASRDEKATRGLSEIKEIATKGDMHSYDKLKSKLGEVKKHIDDNNFATETWSQKFIKSVGDQMKTAVAGLISAGLGKFLRDVYNNVVNLDKAVTNLQIATGKSREEVRDLIKDYSELAIQLGATTTDVANAADTWLRQGYNIEEANMLITNSTMLSKLGQMEAADASRALTSAMKGYNVSVEDSIKIVDKFTAVDMEAAASAGDIATAMAETSASAQIAGVSMDKLIGYITTVKEVTQDGAESVGKILPNITVMCCR